MQHYSTSKAIGFKLFFTLSQKGKSGKDPRGVARALGGGTPREPRVDPWILGGPGQGSEWRAKGPGRDGRLGAQEPNDDPAHPVGRA